MNEIQKTKSVILIAPQLKDNGAFAVAAAVAIAGYGHLRIKFIVGALDAAIGSSDAATPPVLEECDTVDGSYTEIPTAVLPAVIGATDDNKIFAIDLDLTKATRKKYIRPKAPTAGDGTTGANLCIIGTLSKPEIGPANAAEQGLSQQVIA